MLDMLGENIQAVIQGKSLIAYATAFAGGLMTAASPCVLAAMPLVIGYLGGYSGDDRKKPVIYSAAFVLGMSVTFTLLGVAASAMGRLLHGAGVWLYVGLSVVAVAMGLSLLGVFDMPAIVRSDVRLKTRGLAGAFLMGLVLGVISAPCATPVLAVILTYAAAEGSISYGGSLLFAYALGHCMLILAAGVSLGLVNGFINSRGLVAVSNYLRKASGAALVVGGIYVAVKNLNML